ncbi:MAG: S41 family peptidase, partial [Patescibacteria group bacterium]
MKNPKNIILSVIVLFFTFSGGYLVGTKALEVKSRGPQVTISRALPQNHGNLDFSLFWKVWDTLGASYFDKTKLVDSKMLYGAISGMVSSLGDPYTVFLPPSQNKVVDEDLSGNFEGIGIQIGFRGPQLAVIAPLPASPAEKAGVKAGDYIVGITDEGKNIVNKNTSGISLSEAVEIIRGKAGTKVKLSLVREDRGKPFDAEYYTPFEVEVKREKIDVPSVTLTYVGDNKQIAVIKVTKFAAETKMEWDKVVTEVAANSAVAGVIIDVRNNPGGYLQASVDLASEFIPSSKTVVIEENAKQQRNEYKVERIGKLLKMNTVVLINKGSASASEILAGALRDQRQIKLIGETSFGKGTIQEPIEIEGGSGLHVTIAKWLTPNGTWINEKGLKPDTEMTDNEETPEDEQLQKA